MQCSECALDVNGQAAKQWKCLFLSNQSQTKQMKSKQKKQRLPHDLYVSTASHSVAIAPIIVCSLVANEWLLSRVCTRFEANT